MGDFEVWAPPQEFDEYRLMGLLGGGTMGQVYLAHDRVLDRQVAIKFVTVLADGVRERFLVEARAAARLQHPNVMAIHRVGELAGRPFLISEYIRGQTLAELVLPLPWQRALELGLGLVRGLEAAHRQGVLHRDIKLANAMIGEQGEVKLLDFSLAKLEVLVPSLPIRSAPPGHRIFAHDETLALHSLPLQRPGPEAAPPAMTRDFEEGWDSPSATLTEVGSLIGTPHYMAPELWRAEPASRRSDIYALGVLLYILCCGHPPNEARDSGELAEMVQSREPCPLAERMPGIDPQLAAIIDRCIRRDPDDRFADAEELRAALEALSPLRGESGPPVAANPYRGLRAFEAEHRAVFFGRGPEVTAVLSRLRAQSFVLATGDSGVGKSSLCRAGVLPAIQEGALDPALAWSTASITPGRRPVHALLAALASGCGLTEDVLAAAAHGEPEAFARVLGDASGDRGQVVFVDQLEELVTLSPPAEAALAGRLMGELAAGIPGIRLLATARGDFLTRLAQVPGLQDRFGPALYFVPPLGARGVREAIVGPAEARGARFASATLVEELVVAGVEGSLPLLQFALAEIWEARDRSSAVISATALVRLGGVSGALARHADGVIGRLDMPARHAARALLMRLVTLELTRASLTREELVGDNEAARTALDALVEGRLLVVRELADEFFYEIAHEALIAGWTSLRVWLEEEADNRAARHRLEAAASEWDRLGRPREALWGERQLAELRALDPASLRPREASFIDLSAAQVRRRRRFRMIALVSAPLLLVSVLIGVRIAQSAALARVIDAHLTAANSLLERARARDVEVMADRALAFSRFDVADTVAAEQVWSRAIAGATELEGLYGLAARELEAAHSRDSARSDVRTLLGDVLEARALLAERGQDPGHVEDLVSRMRLHDESGERTARWTAPAELSLATTPAGAQVRLERYDRQADGRIVPSEPREIGLTPFTVNLPPGSYRLSFESLGRPLVRYPLLVGRGEALGLDVPLPAAVPAGFVVVPAGRFLFGSAGDEDLRRGFYSAVPMHEVATDAYLIAIHETTYADWIEFLDALPPEQRSARTPKGEGAAMRQGPSLQQRPDATWQITTMVGTELQTTRVGEPLVRPARAVRAKQDWLRLPITGLREEEAQAYMDWLDRSGRVPGARFCTEFEWERAARGADGRYFPTGDQIGPDEANFDQTYGRDIAAMAPDEVGSFPASQSPSGLHDVMGNVYEFAATPGAPSEKVVRGGAFFFGSLSGRTMNRNPIGPEFRDGTLGLRICAPSPAR